MQQQLFLYLDSTTYLTTEKNKPIRNYFATLLCYSKRKCTFVFNALKTFSSFFPPVYGSWLFLLSCHQQSATSVELPFSTVHTSSWYFAPCTSLAKYVTPSFCRVKAFTEPNVSIQTLCNYPEMFQQLISIFPICRPVDSRTSPRARARTHTHTHTQRV